MLTVVLPEDLDLAAEVIVWTADELILTYVSMLLYVLPQDLYTTLVITFDYLKEAALVMRLKVLEHDN